MPIALDPYTALVKWLETAHEGFSSCLVCRDVPGAGRGMFVSEDVSAGATLLDIPSTALLNPLTLATSSLNTIPSVLFPLTAKSHSTANAKRRRKSITHRLNTTQLLTLHLLLTRDKGGRHPSEWSTYLATLPEFRVGCWHPLTWFAAADERDGRKWRELLECLSPGARDKLADVKKRYEEDCEVLRGALRAEDPFAEQALADSLTEEDFLWAWLNVNTRTVSIPLDIPGPSSLQNHTLVPLLDMLNHTSTPSRQIPPPRQIPSSRRPRTPIVPGKIGFRLVAPAQGLFRGEEALFEYGKHSSATLFAEYGFVEIQKDWEKGECGEVDLGDLVRAKGGEMKEEERKEKEEVLKALSCWDSNITHTSPFPPHPSHALLMTLRLLHLPPHSPKLRTIRTGHITYISPSNESAAVASLWDMCDRARSRAEEGFKRAKGLRMKWEGSLDEGVWQGVEGMWEEERVILRSIVKRIDEGETDW